MHVSQIPRQAVSVHRRQFKYLAFVRECLLCLVLMALQLPNPAHAEQHVPHSIDAVPDAIRSPQGRDQFAFQMGGAAPPDGFGARLPAGLSTKTVVRLVLPDAPAHLITLVGVRQLRGYPGEYAAIVCVAPNEREWQETREYYENQPQCGVFSSATAPFRIALGVLQWSGRGVPQLLARLEWNSVEGGPLRADWKDAGIEVPDDLTDYPSTIPVRTSVPHELHRFDLADYRISQGARVFGLRWSFSVPYSGGGADWEGLTLFELKDGALRTVLTEPMYHFAMYGGDWNPDGTRQHPTVEESVILRIARGSTDGYQNLELRRTERKVQWRRTLRWSTRCDCYRHEKP